MPTPIYIRPITEADFSDVLSIANKRLGEDYLNLTDLTVYLNNENKIGLVALVNNEIAGFALAQICNLEETMDLILADRDWFKLQFSNATTIGILKTIAVDIKYSTLGIGTALTEHRIKLLKEKSNLILAFSWEQKQNDTNTKILEKFGLTLKRTIPNYWMEDSLQKGYNCKICGAPPCKCNALIYIK
jgi:ribosomal protein S18 acetylase RimI-like enzyme